MASKSSSRRGKKRILWTRAELKTLRQYAGKKNLSQLARILKRSEPAVRFKAFILRLSLKLKAR